MTCPCCGGEARKCRLGPTGCDPIPESPAVDCDPLDTDWPSPEDRLEHETWMALTDLRRVAPHFITDAGHAWLKERQ